MTLRRTESCHGNFVISHVKLQIIAEILHQKFITYDITIKILFTYIIRPSGVSIKIEVASRFEKSFTDWLYQQGNVSPHFLGGLGACFPRKCDFHHFSKAYNKTSSFRLVLWSFFIYDVIQTSCFSVLSRKSSRFVSLAIRMHWKPSTLLQHNCTYPIRTTGISRRPALMKKVIPATNSPVSSVTVHVYKGLKINWLLKLHRLSRDARIAKRAPEKEMVKKFSDLNKL